MALHSTPHRSRPAGDSRPLVDAHDLQIQHRAALAEQTWPASWHRAVVARVAHEMAGLEIGYCGLEIGYWEPDGQPE